MRRRLRTPLWKRLLVCSCLLIFPYKGESLKESAPKSYSIGYVPRTFPRDPVEINQFLEHMFLGQVLEPIVDSDRYGQVVGGVAKAWTFDESGKRMTFTLNKGKVFSNGVPVRPADVVYSIKRHLGTKSQSAQFLADIESISESGDDKVLVKLKKFNVALIKALSRDQLGVLPKNWKFDLKSVEPYIGTGPYRLIRQEGEWFLVANPHYENKNQLTIPKWKIKFLNNSLNSIPDDSLPDYIPAITGLSLEKVKKNKDFNPKDFKVERNVNYSQTSFWIFPTSDYFKNEENRFKFARMFDSVVDKYSAEQDLKRATGLIPLGISGHNTTKTSPPEGQGKLSRKLIVANLKGVFEPFFSSEAFKEFLKANEIEVEYVPFDPPTLYQLKGKKIDIITGSWAGGFSDPTGFLGLLSPFLGMGFDEYLGSISADLQSAISESNWSSRAEKFKRFDANLVKSGLLIPGWKVPTYTVIKSPLKYKEVQNRYTERFINVTAQ